MLKLRNVVMALAAAGTLAGCIDDPVIPKDPADFHPSLGIDLDAMTLLESGVYILDTTVGEGAVALDTSTVLVDYTGWLKNGNLFDTTEFEGGEPFLVKLNDPRLIEGWQYGVPGMREGGVRTLVIPSELAYGEEGNAPYIHPNATLVFEVKLREVAGAPDETEE